MGITIAWDATEHKEFRAAILVVKKNAINRRFFALAKD